MFRRLVQESASCAVGVCIAALLAALAETAFKSSEFLAAGAGAGFLLIFALPLGLVICVLGRALYKAWRLEDLAAAQEDQREASARITAWILFLVLAGAVQAVGTFQGMRLLFTGTRIRSLIVTGTPVVVLAVTLFLAVLSRPSVNVLASMIGRIESRRAAAGKGLLLTPRRSLIGVFVTACLAVVFAWLLIVAPKLGHLDIGFVVYLIVFALGLVLFPWLWQKPTMPPMVKRGVAVLALGISSLCLILSMWTRYQRPYTMLEVWGNTTLAGWAIDTIYDVQVLRFDLDIDGIEPVPIPDAPHPNVVLITMDTVRADHVPLYGGKANMPAITKFGKSGVVFERAYSPGNVTRRSLPTLASGLSPNRMRGRVAGWALRMDPRHVLLAERFSAGGYDTAGFFCCLSHFGRRHRLGLIRGLDEVAIEYAGAPLTEQALAWIKKRKTKGSDKPLFLWTHYIEPHNWVQDHRPKAGSRRKTERYDLSLVATDGFLGDLLDGIYETLGENTLIVITSDHGEGLGDHGAQHHAEGLYDSEIRVPLIIAGPGITPGRIEQAVGLVDIAPTMLELAGFQPPGMPQMDGLSLAPEILGTREDSLGKGEAYSVMVADRSVEKGQAAIVAGRYKLISKEGKYELYDLGNDAGEKNDIKDAAPSLFRHMKARLARRRELDRIAPF